MFISFVLSLFIACVEMLNPVIFYVHTNDASKLKESTDGSLIFGGMFLSFFAIYNV